MERPDRAAGSLAVLGSLCIFISAIPAHLFHPPCSQLILSLHILVVHVADFLVADYHIPGIPEAGQGLRGWKYLSECEPGHSVQ